MHLVPVERHSRHTLEGERVCKAVGALAERDEIEVWAGLFGLLADPNRLTLLLCIAAAGPISVTDLAVAADMNETTVSQALRLLRASGTVAAARDGRIMRYQLTDDRVGQLLHKVSGAQSEREDVLRAGS